ncbi:unnamed protein product [Clavelina lepadiformis]|uniref:Uncharacterized protein n=1 Tax=Clavelina lepadiformis TaxID=159417 RepID=A0ABP0GTD3_CLALP
MSIREEKSQQALIDLLLKPWFSIQFQPLTKKCKVTGTGPSMRWLLITPQSRKIHQSVNNTTPGL